MPRLYGDVIANAHPTKLLSAWVNALERHREGFVIRMGTPAGDLLIELDEHDVQNIKDGVTILLSYPRITHLDMPTAARLSPPHPDLPLDFVAE